MTPENFGTRSICRNLYIAIFLLRCNYIEKLGAGIESIRTALSANDCPAVIPHFDYLFTLEFKCPTYLDKVNTGQKTREETSLDRSTDKSSKILALIEQYPKITTAELANTLRITNKGIYP